MTNDLKKIILEGMRLILSTLLILGLGMSPAHALESVDTDGDGLFDHEEDINQNGIFDEGETDWLNADTDGGGEADGAELSSGRDPFEMTDDITYDRDNDGLKNGEEEILGTDPLNPDTDGDGIIDGEDPFPLDPEYSQDEDGDGLPDEYEEDNELSGNDPSDAEDDQDGDGLSNFEEFIQGTDPLEPDTDNDGIADGIEVADGTEPLESACLSYTAPVPSFSDTENHWANTFVTHLQQTKILPENIRIFEGYKDGDIRIFLPDRNISRFELLKIAVLSSCIKLAEDRERLSFSFSDVSSAPRPHDTEDKKIRRRIIYTAYRHGIVEGYPDGSFRPDAPVNRAEALKILFLATRFEPFEDPETAQPTLEFPDVPGDEWFATYVGQAAQEGLVIGYPDGTFRPGQPITRAEAGKLVYLLMTGNPWVNGYVIPPEGV